MRPSKLVAPIVVATLACGTALAAEPFTIDPIHSNIVFLIDHLGYAKMVGQFQDYEGNFTFDQDNPTDGSVEVVIQTESLDTDYEARDDDLRSADFFNTLEFPEISFKSTEIVVIGDNTGQITGDFTMLGETRPVTLDVTFNKVGPNPFGQYVAGFSARATLQRSDFGMTTFVPGISDAVDLIIEIEGIRQ